MANAKMKNRNDQLAKAREAGRLRLQELAAERPESSGAAIRAALQSATAPLTVKELREAAGGNPAKLIAEGKAGKVLSRKLKHQGAPVGYALTRAILDSPHPMEQDRPQEAPRATQRTGKGQIKVSTPKTALRPSEARTGPPVGIHSNELTGTKFHLTPYRINGQVVLADDRGGLWTAKPVSS